MANWSKSQIALVAILGVLVVALGGYALYVNEQSSNKTAQASPSPVITPSTAPVPTATALASGRPSPTAAPTTSRCHTAGLSAATTAANSAAGTSYQTLKLTNTSGATCTLYGFAGVSLADASGKQLGQAASRNGAAGGKVTLVAGAAAYASIGFPNAGNFDPGTCSTASTSLRVYPPDEIDALTVADVQQACPGFSVTALSATSL